jgi:hypothetical protein
MAPRYAAYSTGCTCPDEPVSTLGFQPCIRRQARGKAAREVRVPYSPLHVGGIGLRGNEGNAHAWPELRLQQLKQEGVREVRGQCPVVVQQCRQV